MKILVIGFPRSGTTLMYRTIRGHPQMEKMLFETNMMKLIGTQRENRLAQVFPKGKNIGEKVIYEREMMGKKRSNPPTPVEYCKRWNKIFKKEARIIQIIRHPYDVWNSILIKKYVQRDIKDAIVKMEERYFNFVPTCFATIDRFKNCLTIKYEDVVSNPEIIISKIYKHCRLDPNHFPKEEMRTSRLFAYKTKGFRINEPRLRDQKNKFMEIMNKNIDECLEILNQFPGTEYER